MPSIDTADDDQDDKKICILFIIIANIFIIKIIIVTMSISNKNYIIWIINQFPISKVCLNNLYIYTIVVNFYFLWLGCIK